MQPTIGDLIIPPLLHQAGCIPMPTAIARVYTNEGFVIAADGRSFNHKTQEPHNENTQKIFPIQVSADIQLAYSIAGFVEIGATTECPTLNLVRIVEDNCPDLNRNPPEQFRDYIGRLFERI